MFAFGSHCDYYCRTSDHDGDGSLFITDMWPSNVDSAIDRQLTELSSGNVDEKEEKTTALKSHQGLWRTRTYGYLNLGLRVRCIEWIGNIVTLYVMLTEQMNFWENITSNTCSSHGYTVTTDDLANTGINYLGQMAIIRSYFWILSRKLMIQTGGRESRELYDLLTLYNFWMSQLPDIDARDVV